MPAHSIRQETGFDFRPVEYTPWRNYARVYKLCMIASEIDDIAVPTDVARILSMDGAVTCDEYLHFLVEATTDPSPALSNWNHNARIRNPLCFALKYILAKVAITRNNISTINEIIGAYVKSGFSGGESESDFIRVLNSGDDYEGVVKPYASTGRLRQPRESIKFLCQISYLHTYSNRVIATLSPDDAASIFRAITPIVGTPLPDGDKEIQRIAAYFKGGSTHDFFDYPSTTTSDELSSGFVEGSKLKKSHVVIERNAQLRTLFFRTYPTAVCHACEMDTRATYPWTDRVLDVHHILPLSSGTRVDSRTGTLLEDLIAICPTCHRSIHRYYDQYLKKQNRSDFSGKTEAHQTYDAAKALIVRA